MVNAVKTIHRYVIIHFDVNFRNFVWFGDHLKLIDFGCARSTASLDRIKSEEVMVDFGGTPGFRSSEVLKRKCSEIGPKADFWSVGCILYPLFYKNNFPLSSDIENKIEEEINELLERGLQNYVEDIQPQSRIELEEIPLPMLREVMNSCLQIDPSERKLNNIPDGKY